MADAEPPRPGSLENEEPLENEERASKPRTEFGDRMSDADALLWNIESDPALRSTIVIVWVLDRAPDWTRFSRKLESCIAEVPRLHQHVVPDPLGLAPPAWEDDPCFDLEFHVRRLKVPGDGSLRALLDAVEPIGMQAFDRDRPLWELHVFEGLEGGRAGVVLKLHHAISDGVGLVRMAESLVERTPQGEGEQGEKGEQRSTPPRRRWVSPEPPSDLERTRRAGVARLRKRAQQVRGLSHALRSGLGDLLFHPVGTLRRLSEGVQSLGRLMAPVSEPMSPLMRGRSHSSRYEILIVPLDEMKRAGKAVGGSLNDAFVGAVTAGLRRYHEHLGAPVDELRMNMPINMRGREGERDGRGARAGNQFMPVRFAVPISIEDPAERIREIRVRVAAQRSEPALPLVEEISSLIGSLPGDGAARFAGVLMKAVDFTTSNVPGPRFPVYMSGARVEHSFGFAPLAGAALNITCFSYDGELAVSVNADPAAVGDLRLFVECLRKGFDEVRSLA